MQRQSFKVLILFNKDWLHFSEENCADHRVWEISVEWKSVESFCIQIEQIFLLEFLKTFDDKGISICQGKTKPKKLICSQFHFVKFFILEITLKIISALRRSVEIRFFRYFFHIFMNKRRQETEMFQSTITIIHFTTQLSFLVLSALQAFIYFISEKQKAFHWGFLKISFLSC